MPNDFVNIPVPRDLLHHAVRIASDIARRHAAGGLDLQGAPGQSAAQNTFKGPISSTVPGRTDRHPLDVEPGSYVWPADVVSALGEGNTKAGQTQLMAAFLDLTGGIKLPKGGGMQASGVKKPGLNLTLPPAKKPHPPHLGRAEGGRSDVPIIAAGGEHVTPPADIARKFGGLDRGHQICDKIVHLIRAKEMARLKTAPPPKR
jgi:hypothetical protein